MCLQANISEAYEVNQSNCQRTCILIFLCYCICSFISPLSSWYFCFYIPTTTQSHREVDRTPVRRLLLQGVIYHGHGCCSTCPGSPHASWGSDFPGPGLLSARAIRRLRISTPQTTRLPTAHARAYSVCGSHHRQGRQHHQGCHQTDAVKVSNSTSPCWSLTFLLFFGSGHILAMYLFFIM